MQELPSYDELPPAPQGGRSGWNLFGPDDNVGLFNLQTPERIVQASRLIRKGAMFPLDAPLDAFNPPLYDKRGVPRHYVVHTPGARNFDDVYDNFFPQASSQWDGLGHCGYRHDAFYNGATEHDVAAGRRCTIEHWARRGIAGRAVLLDMVATFAESGRPYDPSESVAFSVDDLEAARGRAGVEYCPGDIVIVHTGFAGWYLGRSVAERTRYLKSIAAPGIEHSEEMCRYLWDAHISAIAADNSSVEVKPYDTKVPMGFIHPILIGQFGMALGELWWTEDLAADCAADGVYEMFLSSAPLHAPGAIASPSNALAIK